MQRGGSEKWVQFGRYSLDSMGLAGISKYFDYNSKTNTTREYVMKNIPIMNAFVRIPSQGIVNSVSEESRSFERYSADYRKLKFDVSNTIADAYNGVMTKDALKSYLKSDAQKSQIVKLLKENKLYKKGDENDVITKIVERVLIKNDTSAFGNYFDAYSSTAIGNDELAVKLRIHKEKVGAKQYEKFIQYLKNRGVISDDLIQRVNEIEIENGEVKIDNTPKESSVSESDNTVTISDETSIINQ